MQHIEQSFWGQLQVLQEEIVCNYVKRREKEKSIDFYEITFDTIYSMLEVIDGYRGSDLGISLVDKKSGQIINQDRFLHDRCGEYLRYKGTDSINQ